jgi:hypothetical protein
MKHFLERDAERAVIGIGGHEVAHVGPPAWHTSVAAMAFHCASLSNST